MGNNFATLIQTIFHQVRIVLGSLGVHSDSGINTKLLQDVQYPKYSYSVAIFSVGETRIIREWPHAQSSSLISTKTAFRQFPFCVFQCNYGAQCYPGVIRPIKFSSGRNRGPFMVGVVHPLSSFCGHVMRLRSY